MPEITARTHRLIAETVASMPSVSADVWSEVEPQRDGNGGISVRLGDDRSRIYYYHQPGAAPDPQQRNHSHRIPLEAALSYPVPERDGVVKRSWWFSGPEPTTAGGSRTNGPSDGQTRIVRSDYDSSGQIVSESCRFSGNPDVAYRSLAWLARVAVVANNPTAQNA